jgi:hypothetical protein
MLAYSSNIVCTRCNTRDLTDGVISGLVSCKETMVYIRLVQDIGTGHKKFYRQWNLPPGRHGSGGTFETYGYIYSGSATETEFIDPIVTVISNPKTSFWRVNLKATRIKVDETIGYKSYLA